MERIQHFIQRFFPPAQTLPAGIYHYQAPADAPTPLRLHLRIEPNGEGILIVNASTVLRLNQTAAELAYYLVQRTAESEVGLKMASRYHIQAETAVQDFQDFKKRLDTLIQTPDLDPVGFLGFEQAGLYTSAVTAPYRLDCALTYQCSDGHADAPTGRVERELSTEEWKTILEKAWNAGIPHAAFTGGEPTLRPDLLELIMFTESLGMVSGLLTDGARLADPAFLQNLMVSGLDYVMLLFNPDDPISWQALKNLMPQDISVTVHVTVTAENAGAIPDLYQQFQEMGVNRLSLSTDSPELRETLLSLRRLAAEKGLALVWDMPVPYSRFHPVALEVAEGEGAEGAGKAWLYLEPDGDVLPSQGVNQVLGNFLTDDWNTIWAKHPQ